MQFRSIFGRGPWGIFFVTLLLFTLSQARAAETDPANVSQQQPSEQFLPAPAVAQICEPDPSGLSYLERSWELNENFKRGKYAIMAHRANYILPFSYNNRPNEAPIKLDSPDTDVLEAEVAFQISLKSKLWQDMFGQKLDLWFAYTQRSFWQLYNWSDSAPFRETNYEPELLFNLRMDMNLLGLYARCLNFGFNHQSNGQTEPLSRSWNRLVANLGVERGDFTLLLKGWWRIPESREDDDNPDIDDYMGPGEIWGYYQLDRHRIGVMLRNNLQGHDNRGAVQLEWSFPIMEKVGFYVQGFTGYGESLLDYDHSVNRIGIGFVLSDWL